LSALILPSKKRLYPDPFIKPVHGTRGPCALCGHYSDLTLNHVPPESVGNFDRWNAKSYMTSSTANPGLIFGRGFPNGLSFRTLCRDCNCRLGGNEDKAIGDFFGRVRKTVESPIIIEGIIKITAKPNQLYKGLLAHLVSANDNSVPSAFDLEARELFFGRKSLNLSSWSLFYWLYTGPEIFVMRHAYFAIWHPTVKLIDMVVLKLYPLAFMFVRWPWFGGLPDMRFFLRSRDDEETEIPINMHFQESNAHWPAVPDPNSVIFLGGNSFGIVGQRD